MKKTKKFHLIGICGKGMSALAFMLKDLGYQVTGSDQGFYDPVASMLKNNKIKILTPHKANNIPEDVDMIIIGKHAKLTPEENEEVERAFQMNVPIKSLPEGLGDLIKGKQNTVVAGSFGKSTTTALISFVLLDAKKDPSYFIGAVPVGFKQNSRLGKGNHFILEGDEYPSANWDERSKFLHMNPKNVVLISVEHDHINVFPTEKDFIKPFKELIKILPEDGLVVANASGKNVKKVTRKARCKVVYYGLSELDSWHAENIIYNLKTTFDLYKGGKFITSLETSLLGEHNIENIVGASALLLERRMVSKEELASAIRKFKGISGRIDLKTNKSSVLVYEGFGSSYTKAQAVFDALKLHFPDKRLITIFEPHTFSWRNKDAKDWYKDIFDSSNIIILLPPPTHGAKTHHQMNFEQIVRIVKKHNKGKEVYGLATEKEGLSLLRKITKEDDLIALITSGSLFGLVDSVPKLMEQIFPKK